MNLQETLALIEALRASGVTKFKSQEHDIELRDFNHSNLKKIDKIQTPEQASATAEATAQATEKLKDLINTIKMTPEELANHIFPDGAM